MFKSGIIAINCKLLRITEIDLIPVFIRTFGTILTMMRIIKIAEKNFVVHSSDLTKLVLTH